MKKLIQTKEKTNFILIPSDEAFDRSCVLINAGEDFIKDIERCFDASTHLQDMTKSNKIEVYYRDYMVWIPEDLCNSISSHEDLNEVEDSYIKYIDMTIEEFESLIHNSQSYCDTTDSTLKFFGDFTISFSIRIKGDNDNDMRFFDTLLIEMSEFY